MSVVNDAESLCHMKELIKLIWKSWSISTEVLMSMRWIVDETQIVPLKSFRDCWVCINLHHKWWTKLSVIWFLSNHIALSSTKSWVDLRRVECLKCNWVFHFTLQSLNRNWVSSPKFEMKLNLFRVYFFFIFLSGKSFKFISQN